MEEQSSRAVRSRLLFLELALGARAVANVGFAVYLWLAGPATFGVLFLSLGRFALADGLLAALVALGALLGASDRQIWLLPLASALTRFAVALLVWLGPGIPDFAVTLVLFLGIVASLGLLMGLFDLLAAGRLRHELGRNPESTALAFVGVASAVGGVLLFVVDPTVAGIRLGLTLFALAEGLVLAAATRHLGRAARGARANGSTSAAKSHGDNAL